MNVSWFFSGLNYLQSEVSQYFAFLAFDEKTKLNKPVIKTYYDFENFISTLPEYQKIDIDAYAKIISDFINLKKSAQISHQSASRLGIIDTFNALAHAAKDDLNALHTLASLADQYEDCGLAYATAEGYRVQGKHPELMLKYYHLATVYTNRE